ncbi:MAG: TonB-dependent receptor [Chitinophagaceae bacterium]|nr:TonB-dependent receptor [Rubrivivax sp.]
MPVLAFTVMAMSVGQAFGQAAPAAPSSAASAPSTANPRPSSPATGSATATVDLDTVTISATRRTELIRDVPVSLTKISTDAQLDLGAKELADILQSVPGLNFVKGLSNASGGEVVIRGVSTGVATNPTVAVYIDDVPIGGATGSSGGTDPFDQRLLDLGSIEVLKGPQGTLYGTASMGGLLRYNTRAPDSDYFSGLVGSEVSRTAHGGTNYTAYGFANVPLSQGVAALRVAGFRSGDGGYIDSTGPATAKDINGGTVTGGRVALGLRPIGNLEVRLALQSQETKLDGPGYASLDADGKPVAGELTRVNLAYREPINRRNNLASLNVEADLGWAKASSITGYQTEDVSLLRDSNEGYLRAFPSFLGVTGTVDSFDANLDKTTQEFRLVSPSGRTIDWLAGFFYTREKAGNTNLLTATLSPTSPFPPGVPLLDNAGGEFKYRETAVYGTVVWNLSTDLALTAGVRASRVSQNSLLSDLGVITTNTVQDKSTKDSPETYLLTARYKISPLSTTYARLATGYRAGGVNASVINPGTGQTINQPPYTSDRLVSYELGYKADLPDRQGGFDVSIYQTNWSNLQTTVFSTGAGYIGNAGKARIRGLEFGGVLRPIRSLTLRTAFTLQQAELTEANPGLSGRAGERLPNSPKAAVSVSGKYEFTVGSASSFAALNIGYTGDRTNSFDANAGARNLVQPAYTLVDFNLGTNVSGFDVGLYVRNLTDKRAQLGLYSPFIQVGGPAQVAYARPRTIGVTASRSF